MTIDIGAGLTFCDFSSYEHQKLIKYRNVNHCKQVFVVWEHPIAMFFIALGI